MNCRACYRERDFNKSLWPYNKQWGISITLTKNIHIFAHPNRGCLPGSIPISVSKQSTMQENIVSVIELFGKTEKAVQLLSQRNAPLEVSRVWDLPYKHFGSTSTALQSNGSAAVSQLLDPWRNREGRHSVASEKENKFIKSHIRHAASRVFATDINTLKHVAKNGQVFFKSSFRLPSDDSIFAWRARNRGVTFPPAGRKWRVKTYSERYQHALSFVNILKPVEQNNLTVL